MKAITIKQPWASLIVHGIKDIENRTWRGLTKKSPPKKKFSLSADMRELLCIFRLPNQCKYT